MLYIVKKIFAKTHKPEKNPAIEQRYLSVSEVAKYTGFSPKTIYGWIESGDIPIPGHKIGRIWRFDRLEIDAFMKNSPPAQSGEKTNAPPHARAGLAG